MAAENGASGHEPSDDRARDVPAGAGSAHDRPATDGRTGQRPGDENGRPAGSPSAGAGDGAHDGTTAASVPSGTPEDASPAEDPLTVALTQRDEYLDALRRLQAEFDNYRKRVLSQQAEQAARGVGVLVEQLLPVLDTLDLAAQHLGDAESSDGKALVAVGNQLHDLLARDGLERIDPLGEVFDPTTHEAVGHVPADDDDAEDPDAPVPKPVVAQVMRPGYRWKGTVLRPAMVTVRG